MFMQTIRVAHSGCRVACTTLCQVESISAMILSRAQHAAESDVGRENPEPLRRLCVLRPVNKAWMRSRRTDRHLLQSPCFSALRYDGHLPKGRRGHLARSHYFRLRYFNTKGDERRDNRSSAAGSVAVALGLLRQGDTPLYDDVSLLTPGTTPNHCPRFRSVRRPESAAV